jgi:hypothetical protein
MKIAFFKYTIYEQLTERFSKMYDTFYRLDLLANSQSYIAKCQDKMMQEIYVEW